MQGYRHATVLATWLVPFERDALCLIGLASLVSVATALTGAVASLALSLRLLAILVGRTTAGSSADPLSLCRVEAFAIRVEAAAANGSE